MDRIGFIGTGNIATAVVDGLLRPPEPALDITVSPRNAEKAAALAARFPTVHVARDNQAVLDESRTVFVALRPPIVADTLRQLRFRGDHQVVSLVPMPAAALQSLVSPAHMVVRALPLPTCAERLQAVPYWPADADDADLLRRLGTPLPMATEAQLNALWAATASIASFYVLLETISQWSVDNGVPASTAAEFTASTFHAVSKLALSGGPDRFAALAADVATPGGLNEHVVSVLRASGAYAQLGRALDTVLARIAPKDA